ncbi:MAG: TRAP transporter small permease [Thermodesulfobacteriota bacterium]|nr:TRAP transporter small permease [Thermodesulfobacteriota bacterium]
MFRFLDKTCAAVNQLIEYLLFGLGFSMAILVAVQVFCRYILNSSLFWSEELARYMLVWLSFLGATVAYYRNLHPGVDALTTRISAAKQRISQLLVHITAMGLALIMVISGTQFAWFVRLQISPALSIHKWIILIVIPLSGAVLFVYALAFFLKTLQQESE